MSQKQHLPPAASQFEDFQESVHAAMGDEKVPGLAVILLKDDDVILSRGFGKRNVVQDLDVTTHTLFPIGSSGKAFTAAAVAMLVEEGKLEWDKPVQHYLPTFKLHDSFATEHTTVRDLLTHRSGLPDHTLAWYNSLISRKELVERLQYFEPSADFRTIWQYNNMMYATAGYLMECVTGQSYEAFITDRILKPLGMTSTRLSIHEILNSDDYALPYLEEQSEVREIPFYDRFQIIGPAGCVNTNLEDVQHWLRFQLNKGKHRETQLLAAEQLAENHTPQAVIPPGPGLPLGNDDLEYFPHWSYGMGWFIGSYRGHRMVQHGGAINGFMAEVTLLPDDNAAVAVFTNKNACLAPYAVTLLACDYLLGTGTTDWRARGREARARLQDMREQLLAGVNNVKRVPDAPPSHPLEAYCGEYEHPGYGAMTITQKDAQLHFNYNESSFPLAHIHYDIFEVNISFFGYRTKVSFATAEEGGIEHLAVTLESATKAQVFMRVPDKAKKS